MPRRKSEPINQVESLAEIPVSANALTHSILEYLILRGAYAWRNNSGAARVEGNSNQRGRFIRYGKKGSGDILGILPNGKFLSVEVKAGRDRLRPEQQEFMDDINIRGGVAMVARSLDDVIERIEKELELA